MTNRRKVTIRDIDPKSISTQELYGFVNMATREWKVGRLAVLAWDAWQPYVQSYM
jgi:dynein heavy chain